MARFFRLFYPLLLFTRVQGDWTLGPFTRLEKENPVLVTRPETHFYCPLQKREIKWESKDVFNPSAVVRHGKVHLLYRAEDHDGNLAGTSRIGLAISDDGVNFPLSQRRPIPVLFPDNDEYTTMEWQGGLEDPRVVESPSGEYVMTYTSYNGVARLCIATSRDLINWKKHGSAFEHAYDGVFSKVWSKSGSIVCDLIGDRLVASKINGKYWMYWGESNIYVATSDDLISWSPLVSEDAPAYRGRPEQNAIGNKGQNPSVLFGPRRGMFDSELVEPGPSAIKTLNGIVFIYNSKNKWCMSGRKGECRNGESDNSIPAGTYSAGQVLLDLEDPTKVIGRTEESFLKPIMQYEITGQVANVVFLEGLVFFQGEMFLYYGTADSKIAVARAPIPTHLLEAPLNAQEQETGSTDLVEIDIINQEIDDVDITESDSWINIGFLVFILVVCFLLLLVYQQYYSRYMTKKRCCLSLNKQANLDHEL